MQYKIDIRLIDYDGCLANKKYHETCTYENVNYDNLIAANKEFFKHITQEMREAKAQEYFIGSCSNRASLYYDVQNDIKLIHNKKVRTGSVYPSTRIVTKEIQKEIPECTQITFSMADLYGQLPDGESYHRAELKRQGWEFEAEGDADFYENLLRFETFADHANWTFEEYKISMLYTYMHRAAIKAKELRTEGKQAIVDLHFYDDREDILEMLKLFYETNKKLRPRHVNVYLHAYSGGEVKLYHFFPQNFNGEIDTCYAESVKDMLAECAVHEPNLLTELDVGAFLLRRAERLKPKPKQVHFASPFISPYPSLKAISQDYQQALMAGSNNNTMRDEEENTELDKNTMIVGSASRSYSTSKSVLSISGTSPSFDTPILNDEEKIQTSDLSESSHNLLTEEDEEPLFGLITPAISNFHEYAINEDSTPSAYDYYSAAVTPVNAKQPNFEDELQLFSDFLRSIEASKIEELESCFLLEEEIRHAELSGKDKITTIEVMKVIRTVLTLPDQDNVNRLKILAETLPGHNNYWKMVGGFLLVIAGMALIASAVAIGIASKGFAVAISAKGVTFGAGLIQQGVAAVGFVLGLASLFSGSTLIENGEKRGIAKCASLFWKEAKSGNLPIVAEPDNIRLNVK